MRKEDFIVDEVYYVSSFSGTDYTFRFKEVGSSDIVIGKTYVYKPHTSDGSYSSRNGGWYMSHNKFRLANETERAHFLACEKAGLFVKSFEVPSVINNYQIC